MKVLVVEDEEKIAQFLKKGLTEKGYSVDAVKDTDAALDRLSAGAVRPHHPRPAPARLPRRPRALPRAADARACGRRS